MWGYHVDIFHIVGCHIISYCIISALCKMRYDHWAPLHRVRHTHLTDQIPASHCSLLPLSVIESPCVLVGACASCALFLLDGPLGVVPGDDVPNTWPVFKHFDHTTASLHQLINQQLAPLHVALTTTQTMLLSVDYIQ